MARKVNGSLWINGCVNFKRDFTIQNPIASRFHCKTNVLKKVFNQKLYNIKRTKSIFLQLHPVYPDLTIDIERVVDSQLSASS